MTSAVSAKRITELDGWRAIAVILVVTGHYTESLPGSGLLQGVFAPLATTGVRIFFVISGYVICRGILKEQHDRNCFSLFGFYVRRVFRIIPPLLLYLVAVEVLMHFGNVSYDAIDVRRALLFVCNFKDCGTAGAHLWSLSTEEQFYLIFPASLILLVDFPLLLSAVWLAIPLASVAALLLHHGATAWRLESFGPIGCGVVWALFDTKISKRTAGVSWQIFSLAILCIGVLTWTSHAFLGEILFTLCEGPVIVLILAWTLHHEGPFVRLLNWQAIQWVGIASYSIYLWQQLVIFGLNDLSSIGRLLTLPLMILACIALFAMYERPLIRLGRRISLVTSGGSKGNLARSNLK